METGEHSKNISIGDRIKNQFELLRDRLPRKDSKDEAEIYPGYNARFQLFKEQVRPYINRDKPMLYYASGAALAEFLGSGAKEAWYIDLMYIYTYPQEANGLKGAGLASLFERVKKVDPAAVIEVNYSPELHHYFASTKKEETNISLLAEENPLPEGTEPHKDWKVQEVDLPNNYGKISFSYEGERKVLYFEGRDAIGYVPDEVEEKGCSAFVSIGHANGDLNIAPLPAERYVLSISLPHAWGYNGVVYRGKDLIVSTTQNFTPIDNKTRRDLRDIETLPVILNMLLKDANDQDKFFSHIKFLRGIEKISNDENSAEKILEAHFQRRLQGLTALPDDLKRLAIRDIRSYLVNKTSELSFKNMNIETVSKSLDKILSLYDKR